MLVPLLAYARGAGVDARWLVIGADAPFFAVSKRIHNRLHGVPGDGGPLGAEERALYEATLAANGNELARLLRPDDIVVLHDPQTAGLIPYVRALGVPVVWRCHVGLDVPIVGMAQQRCQRQWVGRVAHGIDIEHFVPVFSHQQMDQGRTDKPGPAGDNDAHGVILS